MTTQKRELEFGVAVGTAGDAKRAVNVTKNLVRLQPSRSPFVCKQAYPRLQNAAVTGHFGPKPAWDFKQSVFNQRAAFEEGRSHLDKGRGKGTRNAFHAAVMADVDDAKANEEDFVAKCVEETTALRECMMKDPGYYGEMDDENGGNDDDDDDDDDEKSKRSENNKSRSESSRKDRSSEKEQKR